MKRSSDLGEVSGVVRQRIKVKAAHQLMMSCFRCGSSSSPGPWHKHRRREESFLCHLCFSHYRQVDLLRDLLSSHFLRLKAAEKQRLGGQSGK